MSEHSSSSKHEYEPMSTVTRYYNDLYYLNGRYANAVQAIDNLIDNSPVPLNTSVDKLIGNEYQNLEWQLDVEPRIARERLTLLPIVIIADKIDASDLEVTQAQQWYRQLFTGITMNISDDHPDKCLDAEVLGHHHKMCATSTDCPRIFIKQYLVSELNNPEFSDDIYKMNPRRMYEIMRVKVQAGIKNEFIEEEYAKLMFSNYSDRYNVYVANRKRMIYGTA
ncbi:MAG: hypothetical protein JWM07_6 [Candidatus Saccharibacteria bacterium]|nr:hypothetical protein [Candidatus Saccharibacteria bacterium]